MVCENQQQAVSVYGWDGGELKNINQILKGLGKLGFRVEFCDGSLVKLYPADSSQPFYSLHVGERAIHPLKRFAKKNWNIELDKV
jgi:hypothetical protein